MTNPDKEFETKIVKDIEVKYDLCKSCLLDLIEYLSLQDAFLLRKKIIDDLGIGDMRMEDFMAITPNNNKRRSEMSEEEIEKEIQDKGLNAPRLNPERINNTIKSTAFHVFSESQLTVCCLTLRNGFTVTGESACASPENFNKAIGEKIALKNAREKIWALEGYLLKQKLSEMTTPPQPKRTIADIAKACHEANRIYCASISDNSQVPWNDAEDWQRKSACDWVSFFLSDKDATPESQHDAWCESKIADGWIYGEIKDAEVKTHPCLVSYDALPQEQKEKDHIFIQTVKSMI